jgi:hypothetical protein
MKKIMIAVTLLLATSAAFAASTISDTNKYAYSANTGWINVRGDATNGAVIGDYTCSGYLYGANIGWISLGDGTPTNRIRYSNDSAADYGVNNDGYGVLSGFAWGANVGWITFETNYGKPRVNMLTGHFEGYAYGANIGWISLSNAQAFVRTDRLQPGVDTNGNGIPDDWEMAHAGNLSTLTSTGDADHDLVLDVGEYRADTDPLNSDDQLHITDAARMGGSTSRVEWTSRDTRYYYVEKSSNAFNNATWTDSGLGMQPADAGSYTERTFVDPDGATNRFYRVKAIQPLMP